MGRAARRDQVVADSRLRPALDAAANILEDLGIRYALVDGLAVSAWGAVRSTKDIDLYAELVWQQRPRVLKALLDSDFDVAAMEEELQQFGVFRSLFRPTNVWWTSSTRRIRSAKLSWTVGRR